MSYKRNWLNPKHIKNVGKKQDYNRPTIETLRSATFYLLTKSYKNTIPLSDTTTTKGMHIVTRLCNYLLIRKVDEAAITFSTAVINYRIILYVHFRYIEPVFILNKNIPISPTMKLLKPL